MYKTLQLNWRNDELQFVWFGSYEIKWLTSSEAHCILEQYKLVIAGEQVVIEALYEEQLIGSVVQLSTLQVVQL